MRKRSRWEPKPLLDEHPWSLLKNMGLTKRGRWISQSLLSAFAVTVAVVTDRHALEVAFAWFVSAWALRYICHRLSGMEAQLGVPRVNEESSFQARLSLDLFASIMFLLGVATLVFSWASIRGLGAAQ